MTFHYLIFNVETMLWNAIHSNFPITAEEIETHKSMGACTMVDISDPAEPRELIGYKQN